MRRESEAVVNARRALGEKAHSAREAADCTPPELAAKLNIPNHDLVALEAGCAVASAGVMKISRVLAGEVRAKWSGETGKLNSCNQALTGLRAAEVALRDSQDRLSATARRLRAETPSVHAFDGAVSVAESCRMLSLKRARGTNPSAAALSDLLNDGGARTSQGKPIREQTVWKHENPDRDDPRRPDQAYVNTVIVALTRYPATRADALDDLGVVDEIFRALNVFASNVRPLRRWAPPSEATSPIDIVDGILGALNEPAGDDSPLAVPTGDQAQAPLAVPTAYQAPIPPPKPVRSRRRAVNVAVVVGVAALVWFVGINPPHPAACALTITTPSIGAHVSTPARVAGSAAGCGDRSLWLISEPATASHAYYPQQQVVVSARQWSGHATAVGGAPK